MERENSGVPWVYGFGFVYYTQVLDPLSLCKEADMRSLLGLKITIFSKCSGI